MTKPYASKSQSKQAKHKQGVRLPKSALRAALTKTKNAASRRLSRPGTSTVANDLSGKKRKRKEVRDEWDTGREEREMGRHSRVAQRDMFSLAPPTFTGPSPTSASTLVKDRVGELGREMGDIAGPLLTSLLVDANELAENGGRPVKKMKMKPKFNQSNLSEKKSGNAFAALASDSEDDEDGMKDANKSNQPTWLEPPRFNIPSLCQRVLEFKPLFAEPTFSFQPGTIAPVSPSSSSLLTSRDSLVSASRNGSIFGGVPLSTTTTTTAPSSSLLSTTPVQLFATSDDDDDL